VFCAVFHLPESTLDDYLMQRLSRYRAERVEEHLSVCQECVERLLEAIEFAQRCVGPAEGS
jgi:hypothetical protein